MPGIAPKPAVVAELQRQMNHEMSAAHAYEALALWCDLQNFKGFARYFINQAAEEHQHARRFMNHLLDRGVLPTLEPITAPQTQFDGLMEVARQAQSMEQANTVGINAAYEVAVRDKDYPAQVLLHWFIKEQVEEEDWADEMVDRVIGANCAGGIQDLDRHLERYLKDTPGEIKDE